jgi:hypothetical protein
LVSGRAQHGAGDRAVRGWPGRGERGCALGFGAWGATRPRGGFLGREERERREAGLGRREKLGRGEREK